jgi:hypothetical protein
MSEALKTFWDKRHSELPRDTTSWDSHASRPARSRTPSTQHEGSKWDADLHSGDHSRGCPQESCVRAEQGSLFFQDQL